jgi:tetratricopeptide (TPR) repeat protein
MCVCHVKKLVEEASFQFAVGNPEIAIESLSRALEMDPSSFEANFALAEVYYSVGKWKEALKIVMVARALKPEDVDVEASLKRIHMRLSELQ